MHKFKIGQLMRMKGLFRGRTGFGIYEVIRLMPQDTDGVPCYRIKDEAGHERAARKIEIEKA